MSFTGSASLGSQAKVMKKIRYIALEPRLGNWKIGDVEIVRDFIAESYERNGYAVYEPEQSEQPTEEGMLF